ncbi:MAG: hypothetical protein AB7E60_09075 [Sphingobium sp.]
MKKSVIAGIVVAILGLLSMGALGGVLAYCVWPVVYPLAGNPDDWRGDDVWPAMIASGLLWGASFPAAGLVNRRLERRGWTGAVRRLIYLLILWCGAALIWTFMLSTMTLAAPVPA